MGDIKMKKGTKKFLGFAIPAAALGIAARKAYVDVRYGVKGPKPIITFTESTDAKLDEIHLTAHRGLSSIVPENTIEAFKEAAKHNYYALECDVHCTTDNKWVIIHDYMLQSMAKEKGDVKSPFFRRSPGRCLAVERAVEPSTSLSSAKPPEHNKILLGG